MEWRMRWQDLGNTAIGLWLLASPWALGLAEADRLKAAALAGGALVVLCASLATAFISVIWQHWITCALGLWQMLSPWALHFQDVHAANVNALVAGFWIAVLSLWVLILEPDAAPSPHTAAGLPSAVP